MLIHPRGFGEVLNEWFRILGRNWRALTLSSLVVHLPVGLIVGALFLVTGATATFEIYIEPESLEDLPAAEVLDLLVPLLWTSGIWVVLQIVAAVVVYLAAARVVAADTNEAKATWRETLGYAWGRTIPALGAASIVFLASTSAIAVAGLSSWLVIASLGAGFLTVFLTATLVLTALVVVTWFGVSVALASQVVALESVGPFHALTRSFTLVRGRWWFTLGYLALITLIGSTVSQVAGFVLAPLFLAGVFYEPAIAIGVGASVLLQGVLIAALGAGQALWYVDSRARQETIMAADLLH